MLGLVKSALHFANSQETTLFVALGFLPTGPAAGTAAASLMTWLGGPVGIQAGSAYAVAQSAAMGGTATGVIATVGGMSVAGLATCVVVPAALAGGAAALWAKM